MALKFDAMVKAGSYTDNQGSEKTRWLKVGAVFENEKGLYMKLEALPVGVPEWNGFISFFEPKPRDGQAARRPQQQPAKRPAAGFDDMDDDIPFS
jgi:hypothetical protein